MLSNADLLVEDLLHIADFALDFAAGLFGRAPVAQVRITRRLAGFLFHFPFGFIHAALDFILSA
jgi:hypothetical protein